MLETISNWISDFGNWLLEGFKDAILGLLEWIAMGIIDNSYWICLIIAIIALLMYIAGIKKSGKWVTGSVIIYFILQALGMAIKSV